MASNPPITIHPLGPVTSDHRQLILITNLLVDVAITPIIQHHFIAIIIVGLIVDDFRPQYYQDNVAYKVILTWVYVDYYTATNKTIDLFNTSITNSNLCHVQKGKSIKAEGY